MITILIFDLKIMNYKLYKSAIVTSNKMIQYYNLGHNQWQNLEQN